MIEGEIKMNTTTYNPQVKNRLLYVGGSIIMTGLSVWLLYMGLTENTPVGIVDHTASNVLVLIGLIGLVIFGFALIFLGKRLISPTPALELRPDGLVDNSTAVATKTLIPYANIKKATVQTFLKTTYINLDIKDEEAVLQSVSKMKRSTMTINRDQFGSGLVLINLTGYKREELEAITTEINQRIQTSQARTE